MATHRSARPLLLAGFLLAVMALASCGSDTPSADDAPSTTDLEPSTTTSSTTPTTVPADIAQACDQEHLVESGNAEQNPPPDEVVVLLDRDGLQLCLGPTLVDDMIIESATVDLSPSGQWLVVPVFTVDGIEQFNAAAASCSRTSTDLEVCPSGRLAMVNGYEVVFSPTVEAANFERDLVIISGNFTEVEARDLAASLAIEGIVLRPVLADLGPAPNS